MARVAWLLVLILVGAVGYIYYRVNSVRERAYGIALRDNVLVKEFLRLESDNPQITYAEVFQRLKSNREEREALAQQVDAIVIELEDPVNARLFKKGEFSLYATLLRTENEALRNQEALYHGLMELDTNFRALRAADKEASAAIDRCEDGRAYINADTWPERLLARYPNADVTEVHRDYIKDGYRDPVVKAISATGGKIVDATRGCSGSIEEFQDVNPKLYPAFFPARDHKTDSRFKLARLALLQSIGVKANNAPETPNFEAPAE